MSATLISPSALRRSWPVLAALLLLLNAGTLLAEERWLLIFDTSSNMKKRLPAIDSELTKFFVATGGQHIHPGDSVGIWTFGSQLHAGELPLFTYQPENAATITTNVLAYIYKQHFAGSTTFELLQPAIGTVIQHSERLTIIIFCDGAGQIIGTPYDMGINQSMADSIQERKKTKQPAIIILRTQRGKYAGGTLNFPPAPSDVPAFPPLSPPATAAATNTVVAANTQSAIKVAAPVQALIINGTAISTNPDVIPAYTPKPVQMVPGSSPNMVPTHNPPATAITAPAAPTQTVAPAPTPAPAPETTAETSPVSAPINEPPATNPAINAATPNPPAATSGGNLDLSTKILLVGGGTFFGMALLLVVLFFTRRKTPETSLITSLMNDDPNRRR